MLEVLALLSILVFTLKRFILNKISPSAQFQVTFAIGLLLIACNLGLFLSSKAPNLYELLKISRSTPLKELLNLVKKSPDASIYYDDVKSGSYEYSCLNSTISTWPSESFSFYGHWMISINVLSFTNNGSSKLLLLLLFLTLALEFAISSKGLIIAFFSYTACEQLQLLRKAVPGVAFIVYFVAEFRERARIEKIERVDRELAEKDQDLMGLRNAMENHGLNQHYSLAEFVQKIFDAEAKKNAKPSWFMKFMKGVAAVMIISTLVKSEK